MNARKLILFVVAISVACAGCPLGAGAEEYGNYFSKRFGDGSAQYAQAVAVDASGNVIVAGFFLGTVDFGGGALTSAGGSDIFVAKFGP